MSRSNGFTLDLYCDAEGCERYPSMDQFCARTEAEARRNARNAGWKLGRSAYRDCCPECQASGRRIVFKKGGHFEWE